MGVCPSVSVSASGLHTHTHEHIPQESETWADVGSDKRRAQRGRNQLEDEVTNRSRSQDRPLRFPTLLLCIVSHSHPSNTQHSEDPITQLNHRCKSRVVPDHEETYWVNPETCCWIWLHSKLHSYFFRSALVSRIRCFKSLGLISVFKICRASSETLLKTDTVAFLLFLNPHLYRRWHTI